MIIWKDRKSFFSFSVIFPLHFFHLFSFRKTFDAIFLASYSEIPIWTANFTFLSIFSCSVVPSSKNLPFLKQWKQYSLLLLLSAFVPKSPFFCKGIPQLWHIFCFKISSPYPNYLFLISIRSCISNLRRKPTYKLNRVFLGLSEEEKVEYLRKRMKFVKRMGIIYYVLSPVGLLGLVIGFINWVFDLIIVGVTLFVVALLMGFYSNKRKNELMEQLRKMGYKEKE